MCLADQHRSRLAFVKADSLQQFHPRMPFQKRHTQRFALECTTNFHGSVNERGHRCGMIFAINVCDAKLVFVRRVHQVGGQHFSASQGNESVLSIRVFTKTPLQIRSRSVHTELRSRAHSIRQFRELLSNLSFVNAGTVFCLLPRKRVLRTQQLVPDPGKGRTKRCEAHMFLDLLVHAQRSRKSYHFRLGNEAESFVNSLHPRAGKIVSHFE